MTVESDMIHTADEASGERGPIANKQPSTVKIGLAVALLTLCGVAINQMPRNPKNHFTAEAMEVW
jgi:hypothetical protein